MSAELLLIYPLLVFSVILHEVAHGLVALEQGDETALLSGRLTLNPLSHLDPVGSVIFPIMCAALKLPVFGWAKPVPVNPSRFRHPRSGIFLVSLAGPLTNFLIAVAMVAVLYVIATKTSLLQSYTFLPAVFSQTILLNLVLGVFNLFPIPPLDGSKILSILLPSELSVRYNALERYGFFIVMGLLAFGVLGRVMYPMVEGIYGLLMRTAGLY